MSPPRNLPVLFIHEIVVAFSDVVGLNVFHALRLSDIDRAAVRKVDSLHTLFLGPAFVDAVSNSCKPVIEELLVLYDGFLALDGAMTRNDVVDIKRQQPVEAFEELIEIS